MKFDTFFKLATGNPPYPYQTCFAKGERLPDLLSVPTGVGKTATAVLGWLYRRRFAEKPDCRSTPRRIVYCLPMRTLVEQTQKSAESWIGNLVKAEKLKEGDVKVHLLMGGVDHSDWDQWPERDAILIGTQDMLLSRALNRGYGMSRYRWPMHFGLLNNDCLWVMDELELMGKGLASSSQVQAFREFIGTFGTAATIWMSATLLPRWLASVDYRDRIEPNLQLQTLALDPKADYKVDGLRERWNASKSLLPANLSADAPAGVAAFVQSKHHDGSLTLVIVNTVDRCRTLFTELKKSYQPPKPKGGAKKPDATEPQPPSPELRLVHSRFRPREREGWQSLFTTKDLPVGGRIIVSTQVVEAGVDMSARTLITELAPWPSLVQRFGRCNRAGEFSGKNSAQVFWVDVPTPDERKATPYAKAELDEARTRLSDMADVGLKALTGFFRDLMEDGRNRLFPFDPLHVIRRKDFIDLFDTTPDLAGQDIDVSRFIRDGDEIDVQVYWRASVPPKGEITRNLARQLAPVREELCAVKIADFREFLDGHIAHRWDSLSSEWVKADAATIYAGQVYWIAKSEGGYDAQLGWSPNADWTDDLWLRDPAAERESDTTEEPGYDSELMSLYMWQSIAKHTDDVVETLEAILKKLNFDEIPAAALLVAARWHDWGKAHFIFQDAIRDDADGKGQRPPQWAGKRDLAKAAPEDVWRNYKRKHFRHELASALGVLTLLKSGQPPSDWQLLDAHLINLALYLIAAHHGKVRLSIRSLPDECKPAKAGALFARGVWEADPLPSVDLGGSVTAPALAALDLSPMLLGRGKDGHPSWAERMLRLRDDKSNDRALRFGPLKLAYLEALIRAADIRASKAADEKATKTKESQA